MAAEFLGVIFLLLFFLVVFAIIIGAFVLWIMMIVDAAKRDFPGPNDKIVWILIIVLAQFLGAIIYYFVIKRPADKQT